MVLSCTIHLDKDPPIYSSGDIVEGVVVLSSTWTDKLTGISIKLAKKLEVEWDTYKLYDRQRTSSVDDVAFVSECDILENGKSNGPSLSTSPSTSSSLGGNGGGGAPVVVPSTTSVSLSNLVSKRGIIITRGVTHRYPFLLKIAYELDLPASFRGTYGYIAYKLVAFLKSPKKGVCIGATKDIGIFPILDLNYLEPSLQKPIDEKRVFKSLFGYNYVFMKVHLDKKAYLPEQLLTFTTEVTNKSPAILDGVEVHLNMNTHFSVSGASKIETRTLLRIRGPCIAQGEHGIWSHSFTFPPALPTGLGAMSRMRSKFIDVQYTLQFSLEVSKAEKFFIPIPIVIGTVPFARRVNVHHQLLNDDDQLPAGAVAHATVTYAATTPPVPVPGGALPAPTQWRSPPPPTMTVEASRRTPEFDSNGSLVTDDNELRPRSSSLPPSYSSSNLQYFDQLFRRAETPPPSYKEARLLAVARTP